MVTIWLGEDRHSAVIALKVFAETTWVALMPT